jgi:hypothetical protein
MTEDGRYRQPAALLLGNLTVEAWPDPRDAGGLAYLQDNRIAAGGTVVSVERWALLHALKIASSAPFDLADEDEGWPSARLLADEGKLDIEVRWPVVGSTSVLVPAGCDGQASCWVDPIALFNVVQACDDEVVTLRIPDDGRPLSLTADQIAAFLQQAPSDADLAPLRGRLLHAMRTGLGVVDPLRDADGDYPIRVGDADMYIRLARRASSPPVVQVFATLVKQAEAGQELLEELNALNTSASFCRLFHVDGQVLVEAELLASDLHPDELEESCRAVSGAMQRFGPLLRARFEEAGALAEAATPPIDWEAFGKTAIRIRSAQGWTEFTPSEDAECAGAWPFSQARTIAVVTAYNPLGRTAESDENARAQQALVSEMLDRGVLFAQAVGIALDGGWSEPSFALLETSVDDAVALARQFGQAAIFVLTPSALELISCIDGQVVSSRSWVANAVA